MRLLIAIVIALFLSAGIALVLREDPGYAMLSMGTWTVETSVAFAVFFLIVAFALFYALVRFLIRLITAPSRARKANREFRLRRSQRLLVKGMKQLIEGRWKRAEISLMKGVEYSPAPALYLIGAARAARRMDAGWRADGYFYRAEALPPDETLPAKLTQAEFLLEDGRPAEARDLLVALLGEHPRQPRALELLARSYQALDDWHKLHDLLPDLGKSDALEADRFREVRVQAYSALLNDTAHHGSLDDLHASWEKIPQDLRTDETLLIEYAGHLRDHNAATEAEALLREAITAAWSDKLVVGYGEIGRGNLTAQLGNAEEWLKSHENNPYLLLTCGRLAKRARQPERAQSYLQRSINVLPTPDALQELGEVLEEAGDKDGALQCYRTSLRLLSGKAEEKEGAAVVALGEGAAGPALAAGERVALTKEGEQAMLTAEERPPEAEARPEVVEESIEEEREGDVIKGAQATS